MKRQVHVYRSGNGLVVTLPVDWTRGLGLHAGMLLEMEYTDHEMAVRLPLPIPAPKKKDSLLLQLLKTTQIP